MNNNVKILQPKYFFYGIVVVVVFTPIALYSLGYRLGNGFRVGKLGYLALSIPLPETTIYIDESKKIVTTKENEEVKVPLSPKEHSIIISRQSYYPWKKNLEIQSKKTVSVSPMFVSQNPSGSVITKNDPEYWKIYNLLNKNTYPKKDLPKTDGNISIWVENNTVMAKIDEKIIEVIKPEEEVRNLEFYKNAKNAVIFSAGKGIYAIEIDKTGTQNFMPVYVGEKPLFIGADKSSIYVLDVGTLMQVII